MQGFRDVCLLEKASTRLHTASNSPLGVVKVPEARTRAGLGVASTPGSIKAAGNRLFGMGVAA
jgi:hypothetical protein